MSIDRENRISPLPTETPSFTTSSTQAELEAAPQELLTASFRGILGNDSANMDFDLAARCVTILIQEIDPTLNLSRLLRWEVAEDIYETAEQISTELGQDIRLTKTENSFSGGRIIGTIAGSIVLVPAQTFRNLVDGPDGVTQFTINLLHHELCHVHDEAVRKAMPGWKDEMSGLPLTNRMIDIMIWLWDEYSANRRSASTSQILTEKEQLKLVVSEYPRVNCEITASIQWWRTHQDMRQLFSELASSFGHIFKLMGYVLGSLAGRDLNLEQFDPVSYSYLRQTWLASLLEKESIEQLNTLYQTFGNWSGIEVFDDFSETCRLVYWDAGIQICASPDGLTANILD